MVDQALWQALAHWRQHCRARYNLNAHERMDQYVRHCRTVSS